MTALGQAEIDGAAFREIRDLLHAWTGIALAENKRHLVVNRLAKRVSALGLADYSAYLQHIKQAGSDSDDGRAFVNSLTTNKTAFFRESGHFDFLTKHLLPQARQRAGGQRRLRIWCAAASTGEEPYTLAMVLRESGLVEEGWDVRLLASDVDTEVLAWASRGVYDSERIASVPPALRTKYFQALPGGIEHQVDPALRAMITFARVNLIAQPFAVRGQFDAIFCRNVMIYFDRPTQIRLVDDLCRQLAPGGCLFVGHSESLIGFANGLEVVANGVYRPQQGARALSSLPASTTPPKPSAPAVTAPAAIEATAAPPVWTPALAQGRRPPAGLPSRHIILGQWFASATPAVVSTLLGSCVAACLYDPVARVGGMNHFMLPNGDEDAERPARFGVHAMEVLINDLMQLGAQRSRLEAKIFGAAAVTKELSPKIALGNASFVRSFLAEEKIRVVSERLGGDRPHEVALRTDTGEAFHRTVIPANANGLARAETETWKRLGRGNAASAPAKPRFEIF